MAYSWPLFLYKSYVYDQKELSKGLFQSDLLIKAFKCIFTSPGSAHRHDGGDDAVHFKGPCSHNHVADLVRM
ncbi:hypothetical protein HD554DRAFT_2177919 [Boletus coccyginus]|nr:hypothetical protein HD554DRAFT_2177919 [Boletus coccyginus]